MSFKNAELEAKHQKYKGRVVLRGDILKDDSGSYAVFTEQGSSASQMTAAKVMAQGSSKRKFANRFQPCPSMVCCPTECRFANQCWRPLRPYTHPKEGRAQRWADLWKFLAHEETRESHRLGMPRVRRGSIGST